MRALLVAALAILAAGCARPAWEQEAPPIRTGPVVDAARFTRGRLANGLTVMVFEDPRLPLALWGVALRRGAGIESLDEAGLATFTAALMERGAGGRDAVALARSVDDLGASFDADAGWDTMTVQVSGLSRDADALWGVLGDVVLRPDFEPDEADSIRAEQLAALEKERDEPASLAQQALARVLYDGHRYALPPSGEPGAVAGLSAADARAFHARVFVPGNAILFAAGDVTWADVEARARATFGAWPEATVPEPTPPPPAVTPEARRVVVVDRPDLGQAQVLLGHEGIARDDPDRLAAGFMSRVLGGGGLTSRLMARVRKDEGLTYGIYSGFAMRRQPGPFFVSTFTRVPEVGRLVEIVLDELERMRDEPIGDAEVRSVKRQSAGVFVLSLETSEDVLDALVDLDVHGLPEDALDTYRARVVATTTEDVNRQARQRLHPDRIAVVVVGPAEALRAPLEAFGPVEVVQP